MRVRQCISLRITAYVSTALGIGIVLWPLPLVTTVVGYALAFGITNSLFISWGLAISFTLVTAIAAQSLFIGVRRTMHDPRLRSAFLLLLLGMLVVSMCMATWVLLVTWNMRPLN